MTFRHGKTTLVLVGTTDLSAYLNDSSVTDEVAADETTTYGQGAHTYLPGLEDVTVSMSGLYDGDEGAVDEVLQTTLKGDELVQALVVSDSPAQTGNRCAFLDAVHTSYEVSNPVADVVSISAELQGSNGSATGLLLSGQDELSADGTSPSVDGGDYSSTRALLRIHVLANTRDGVSTFQFEQSADDVTFANLGTAITVPAGETGVFTVEVDGSTVERYLQLDRTLAGTTGSVTIVAAAARL